MKINATATDKITTALAEVQNPRVTTHRIKYADITVAIECIEQRLRRLLKKGDWPGLKISVDPNAQIFPTAYWKKGSPKSTQFTLERFQSGWFIVDISRRNVKSPPNEYVVEGLEAKKEELLKFVSDNFI